MLLTVAGSLLAVIVLSAAGASAAPTIRAVRISRQSFNPSVRETMQLSYSLESAATVDLDVYDSSGMLVRSLLRQGQRRAGLNTSTWDGRDDEGRVAPNEAYFFTIAARSSDGQSAVYDPTTFSGGEFGDIGTGQVSRRAGTVSYQLSNAARVLLRAGMAGSAMLKTIVDWEPRPAGAVTEYWNGMDEDNLIDVLSRRYTMILSYVTLPENSVITFGNDKVTYRQYISSLRKPLKRKESRPSVNNRRLSPHFLRPRSLDRSFNVKVEFPELERGRDARVPQVADRRLIVRLNVDPGDREVIEGQQFEIIIFVDTVFYAEEERGYLPFNCPVELGDLPPGEHTITVNIITFGDQIGVGSRKIKVTR